MQYCNTTLSLLLLFKKKNGNKFMNFSLEFARENMTIIVLNKIHECFAQMIYN